MNKKIDELMKEHQDEVDKIKQSIHTVRAEREFYQIKLAKAEKEAKSSYPELRKNYEEMLA